MAEYRVICTIQEPPEDPHTGLHIVSVGLGASSGLETAHWGVADVYSAMDRGDMFYTQSPSTGARAEVRKGVCGTCDRTTLRSATDAWGDNDLANIPSVVEMGGSIVFRMGRFSVGGLG